jgi:hypothetical protein
MIGGWTILRIIFSLAITMCSMYITQYITAIGDKKCEFAKSLYVSNGKLLSSLLMFISVVNIFIPVNKFLSNIPIIGSSYVFLFMLLLFMLLFILKRIVINLNEPENKKCNNKNYKSLTYFIDDISYMQCFYITIIISVVFFYL